jgi:hypothetical protein
LGVRKYDNLIGGAFKMKTQKKPQPIASVINLKETNERSSPRLNKAPGQ